MNRVYTFNAGPSAMPIEVLETAKEQMLCYKNSGMSVLEMSHRSKDYDEIITTAESNLRKLMNIPSNYKVLFMQGGASSQFAMVPLNLMKTKKADYVVTGAFAKKAAKEAEKYGEVRVVASSADQNFNYIPKLDASMFSPDADYIHITSNNTIFGTSVHDVPKTNVPLVADMSSDILSKEVNVADYGLIYAGAQKNMGPAGLTIVIIREDLLGNVMVEDEVYNSFSSKNVRNASFDSNSVLMVQSRELGGIFLGSESAMHNFSRLFTLSS